MDIKGDKGDKGATGETGATGPGNLTGHWYRLAAYVLVVVAGVGGLYASQVHTTNQIHRNQIESCERGNLLRTNLNTNNDAMRQFLHDAMVTRRVSADTYRLQGNLTQARINDAAAAKCEKIAATMVDIQMVDCKSVIR